MKKLLAFVSLSFCLVAGAALASDFISGIEYQTGSGANGMSRVNPSLATDGVAVQSARFTVGPTPIADYVKVTIQSDGGVVPFINPLNTAFLRCWHYAASPFNPANFAWTRCPYLDISVDAGTSVTLSGMTSNYASIEFPAMGPLPVEAQGNRYDFAAENIMTDAGTGQLVDGGIFVLIQYITP